MVLTIPFKQFVFLFSLILLIINTISFFLFKILVCAIMISSLLIFSLVSQIISFFSFFFPLLREQVTTIFFGFANGNSKLRSSLKSVFNFPSIVNLPFSLQLALFIDSE